MKLTLNQTKKKIEDLENELKFCNSIKSEVIKKERQTFFKNMIKCYKDHLKYLRDEFVEELLELTKEEKMTEIENFTLDCIETYNVEEVVSNVRCFRL